MAHSKPRPKPHNLEKDRLIFKVQRTLRGLSPREIVAGTENDNPRFRPVAVSTVRNWYIPIQRGGTRYPQANTLNRVLNAHGYELAIVIKHRTNY